MELKQKKELARDIIALGSIPFYFIVIIRAVIGTMKPFVVWLLLAALVIFILGKIVGANMYAARAVVLFTFISFYYKSMLFSFFAFLLLIALFFAVRYQKVTWKQVGKGIIVGVLATVGGYYFEPFLTPLL